MEVTFLGTGTSMGVPMIGCNCAVCSSEDPRNKRLRSSVYIQTENNKFIIDTTPEFRIQMIRENIKELDFILFTHDHADHILGIDDLRPLCKKNNKTIPCYGSRYTLSEIKERFPYLFSEDNPDSWRPKLDFIPVEDKFEESGLEIIPLSVEHGNERALGYRIKDFAYISDLSDLPEQTAEKMKNLEVLVLDGLRFEPHYKHFHIEKAIETSQKLNPKKTYLTHLTHAIGHDKVEANLPENIHLAYDGLKLQMNGGS